MATRTQQEAIQDDEWDVLIWLDAGRLDDYEELAPWTADLEAVYNGGFGYTGDWMAHHFPGEYDATFFHSGQPIYTMLGTNGYDERQHFARVPGLSEYVWDEEVGNCLPAETNRVVREHYDGGKAVIRYIAPHPPFPSLIDLTRSKMRVQKTTQAIQNGEVSVESVRSAYRDYYHSALVAVGDLLEHLEGRVVLTADHGELFGEQDHWYHGRNYPDIPALTEVPWVTIQGAEADD